jgi:hypothetical protein
VSTTVTRRPIAQGTYSNYTAGGHYSKVTAVSDGSDDPTNAAGDSTVLNVSAIAPETFLFAPLGIDPLSVISSHVIAGRGNTDALDSIAYRARLASIDLDSPTMGMTGTYPAVAVTQYNFPRPGGGKWSVADVDAAEGGWAFHNFSVHATPSECGLYRIVTYQPVSILEPQVRTLMAQLVSRYGCQPDRVLIPVAATLMGLTPGQLVAVSHALLPSADGYGRGSKSWQRFIGRVVEHIHDLENVAAGEQIRAEDLEDQLKRFWDGAIGPREPGGNRDGVLYLSPGGARGYDGPPTVVQSPVSGLLMRVVEDAEPIGAQGALLESPATNQIVNSAFILGLANWTTSADGVTLDTIATSGWDPSVVSQHARIQKASIGDGFIQQGLRTAGAGWMIVSVRHAEENLADILKLRLRRISDSMFWNAGTGLWQAGTFDNPLPNQGGYGRDYLLIDQTAGATTYTVSLRIQNVGMVSHVDHVQLEGPATNGHGWASSPIVTLGAPVTRAASTLFENNDAANRKVQGSRGTWRFRWQPLMNSADIITGTDLYLGNVGFDTNNWIRWYYDVSAQALVFEIRAGGATRIASYPLTFTVGQVIPVVVTWQSLGGENDDANYTFSVSVGAQSRAINTAANPITETPSSNWWIGSLDGTQGFLDGFLWDRQVLDAVKDLSANRRWVIYGE